MKPLRVGVIGYDGVQALDLIGPSDAFSITSITDENGTPRPGYEVIVLGLSGKSFRAESGVLFQPHCPLRNAPTLDTASETPPYLAWLGGYNKAKDDLSQKVAVPAGAVGLTLSFSYKVITQEVSTDAAFDHLRSAVDHRPDLAESAKSDHDLESLHGDPRFQQIVG